MKVTFISYPKSGRTWMRFVFNVMKKEVVFTHAGHVTSRENIFSGKKFTDVDSSLLTEKNIFMHRNPVDTAVSMYFQVHKHELYGFKKKMKPDYFLALLKGKLPPKNINEFVLDPLLGVENICMFNRGWLDFFEQRPDVLVVTYEEAQNDLRGVVSKLVKFCEIESCDIDDVVMKSSFDSMKKYELTGKSRELRLHGLSSGDPDTMKVRKGVVKGYVDYLDKETIEKAKAVASRYGFEA